MIKVVVVDDQNSIREFLRSYLAKIPGIYVVGTASNGTEAIRMVKKYLPDLVLMDIEMPLMNGIEATQIISRYFTQTKTLLLTSKEEKQLLTLALQAGARGYILKTAKSKDIDKIIHLTIGGYFQFGPIKNQYNYSNVTTKFNKTSKLALANFHTGKTLNEINKNILEIEKVVELQQDTISKLLLLREYDRRNNSLFQEKLLNFAMQISLKPTTSQLYFGRGDALFIMGFVLGIMTALLVIVTYLII